jgi:hypothetical protein
MIMAIISASLLAACSLQLAAHQKPSLLEIEMKRARKQKCYDESSSVGVESFSVEYYL